MTEYGEPLREKKVTDGVDACEPSITRISAQRWQDERGEVSEKGKAEKEKMKRTKKNHKRNPEKKDSQNDKDRRQYSTCIGGTSTPKSPPRCQKR